MEKKTSDVDYVICTPNCQKTKRLYHVNMLKPYRSKDAPVGCKSVTTVAPMMPSRSATASEEKVVRSMKFQNSDVLSNLDFKLSHLLEKERGVIKILAEEFSDLFPDFPGRTVAASHDVDVGTARPVKQHPYRMNPTKLEALRQEVEYMLRNGIIEQSHSQWSSPCILVPKPDNTY